MFWSFKMVNATTLTAMGGREDVEGGPTDTGG